VYCGYIGAILLFIFGAITQEWLLVGIAAFGGVTCWMTLKQLQFTDGMMGFDDVAEMEQRESAAERRAAKKEAKQRLAEEDEAAEVDRILEKIATHGMESLSPRERKLLKRATDRRKND